MTTAELGPLVTRVSLENALTFDLVLLLGELPKLVQIIVHHYDDKTPDL
jgi:hypothetical protein